jgi:flagellar protein FliS
MAYGLHSYKRTDVQTADPRKIIVLLYEGAVRNLNQAVAYMDLGDHAQQSQKINKTLAIIQFLQSALDHDQGGEIAEQLNGLYDYMRDTLSLANINNDPKPVREVVELFNTLLEGWQGILDSPAEQSVGEAQVQGDGAAAAKLRPSKPRPVVVPTPPSSSPTIADFIPTAPARAAQAPVAPKAASNVAARYASMVG